MAVPTLQLTSRRARVLHGHPWVYATEVAGRLPPEWDGTAVALRDPRGRDLGLGLYNGQSQICWRRHGRGDRPCDAAFLEEALREAIGRRREVRVGRLVWAEADGLPGLVVDQYGDLLVVQVLTLALARLEPVLADLLQRLRRPREILFRNDAPSRAREGLPLETRTLSGRKLEPDWLEIGGVSFWLDWEAGHKTGFYLDQREQHQRVAAWAAGRRVLDAFCNQGAFGLHCARAGAAAVLGIDSSEECLALARRNAAHNRLPAEFQAANLFDWLTAHRGEQFDLIVLDPPSFARSKSAVEGARRGYKELNLRALRLLSPGGVLATYSCSQHISRSLFGEIVAEAAADSGRRVAILDHVLQPPDHPVIATIPETEYLKGLILEAR